MIRKYVEQYLTFTKGERHAVIALTAILLVLFALPRFLPRDKLEIDNRQLVSFEKAEPAVLTETSSSTLAGVASDTKSAYKRKYFDPNTLDAAGWVNMGVKEKTAITIQHYLEKGGRFRKAEDLLKIYGLPGTLASELMSYVRIKNDEIHSQSFARTGKNWANDFSKYPDRNNENLPASRSSHAFRNGNAGGQDSGRYGGYRYPSRKIHSGTVDIAIADTSALTTLPGIGSKLAARIVSFRQKLGGFHSVEQLGEVFGIQDSLYRQLRPLLAISPGHIRTVNINTATEEELKAHPYIRWQLAKLIVNYRTEHGPFSLPTDLAKLQLLNEDGLIKLLPYLTL